MQMADAMVRVSICLRIIANVFSLIRTSGLIWYEGRWLRIHQHGTIRTAAVFTVCADCSLGRLLAPPRARCQWFFSPSPASAFSSVLSICLVSLFLSWLLFLQLIRGPGRLQADPERFPSGISALVRPSLSAAHIRHSLLVRLSVVRFYEFLFHSPLP